MDQFAGLPVAAETFLAENRRPLRICSTCGHVTKTYIEKYDTFLGMFMNEYPLYRHQLKNGQFAEEFLQAAPWSGGPIHFLGLRLSDGTEFKWPEEDMAPWL
jgi:hypothetical protein